MKSIYLWNRVGTILSRSGCRPYSTDFPIHWDILQHIQTDITDIITNIDEIKEAVVGIFDEI
mgnify:CR=1 FL=1